MTDINTRAAGIFETSGDGIHWPYGLTDVDRRLRKTDPLAYERLVAELAIRREVLVSWADGHGLKASTVMCCPRWLTRKVSRGCTFPNCTRYGGSGATSPDSDWMDHAIHWNKDGKPAVITTAPYNVSTEDQSRIDWWTREHPFIKSAQGEGWYGYLTRQIILWHADRIGTVTPAALPSKAEGVAP